ncbi:cadherin-like beta sandwich domain-containing protein [Aneurinibacillus uraniidurans]|uniref:cadherin-like beta sandwich domain-containing protein n=1 Tax=Aneurinibacillus uraniidurans TaxID=2966586 RepID=UPI00234A9011|nr:cadherin-like beta sandwich domain-containing protein [Aneurinibacillus sp. B1]WCN39674.1 cadherin-like beta sandwich domain-containing protein [Aneurinibacillus sp. B1]
MFLIFAILCSVTEIRFFVAPVEASTAWTLRASNTGGDINGITYANGLFVGADNRSSNLVTSTDGATWNAKSFSGKATALYSSAYGAGKWVLAASDGKVIVSNDNTVTWGAPIQAHSPGNDLWSITYGNGRFIAVGASGAVTQSVDGVTWSQSTLGPGAPTLYSVIYAGGQFVTVGTSGSIYTSPDGTAWTKGTIGSTTNINSIAYGNGLYVVATDNGLYSSVDGITWAKRYTSSSIIYGVTYGGNKFVAVGAGGNVYVSQEGIFWTIEGPSGTSNDLYSVASGGGQFVAVGANGILLTQSQSSVADLSSLLLSAGTLSPSFSSSTTSYTASVSNATTSLKVTPTVADAYATVTVNGASVTSGTASSSIPLTVGSNTITVVVTAQDGSTTKSYTISVTRAAPLSTNADLSDLVLSQGTLSPAFSSGTTSYTTSVGNEVTSLTVTPTVADSTASVKANGTAVTSGSASIPITLNVGSNTITVLVTAQNGSTKTYMVTVNRASSSNANLSNLTINQGTLSPAFASGTTDYTTSVANGVSSIDVTSTVADSTATMKVNGSTATSGTAFNVPLTVGTNPIAVQVTAQDGITQKTYTVIVTRAPSSNANLSGITVYVAGLNEPFSPDTTTYTQSLANGATETWVKPTVADANATVTVNGISIANGQVSGAIPLQVGSNTVTIVVTAQDGTTKIYKIIITRAPSNNSNLSGLTSSHGTLSPAFASGTTSYTANVENAVSSLTVTPTVADSTATVKVNSTSTTSGVASNPISLNVGSNTITVLVTAQDGTSKAYTVTVTRAAQTDAEAVAAAKAALDIGYAGGDSASSVMQNVTLGTTGANGTTINWASNNSAMIAANGAVTRPTHSQGDQTITLTATITKGGESDTKSFTVTVKALAETDTEAVAAAKAALDIGYAGGDSASSVTQNVTLGTTGANGTTVSWSSSNLGVLAVDGTVTRPSNADGNKTVILTASINKGSVTDTKEFNLTVIALSLSPPVNVPITGVSLDQSTLSLTAGGATGTLTAAVLPANATNKKIIWSSSDQSVATVLGGVVTPLQKGTTTITVTSESDPTKQATCLVTVEESTTTPDTIAVTGVSLDQSSLTLTKGGATGTLTAAVRPADATNKKVLWSSSDPNVAAVDENGIITPVEVGTTTITVTTEAGGYTATSTVTVNPAPLVNVPVTDVVLDKTALNLTAGGSTARLTATVKPDNATNKEVMWSSDNSNIATVDANGVVTPKSAGTATITVTTAGGNKTAVCLVTVQQVPSSGGGSAGSGGGGGRSSTPALPSTPSVPNTGVEVLVNGEVENAGTATTTKVNGQTVTTITVDAKKIEEKLAAEGQHAVITIPVNDKSDVVVGEMTGQMVKNMEQKQAVVEIKTNNATYTLPAQQINIDAISDQIGKTVALQDIKIHIEIAKPTAGTVKVVENSAAKGEFMIVAPPLNFTVKGTYGDKTIDVSKFNAYVERTIALPEGIDPNKVTTGVVVDPDGTVRHVPTKIVVINGKYFAKVNSLTNSTYSVVWHLLEFKDVEHHWAKQAVNDMGSRMVISGTGNDLFHPDQDITRAEFAAIIVRGLGLKLENGPNPFADVKAVDWYSSSVQTAYKYNLISGFEDGTFHPMDRITREQATVIIAKAMKTTGLHAKLQAKEAEELLQPFTDAKKASEWAKSSLADCLQAGLVSGRNGKQLAPKEYITRAEVAAIVQRLLQKSEFI